MDKLNGGQIAAKLLLRTAYAQIIIGNPVVHRLVCWLLSRSQVNDDGAQSGFLLRRNSFHRFGFHQLHFFRFFCLRCIRFGDFFQSRLRFGYRFALRGSSFHDFFRRFLWFGNLYHVRLFRFGQQVVISGILPQQSVQVLPDIQKGGEREIGIPQHHVVAVQLSDLIGLAIHKHRLPLGIAVDHIRLIHRSSGIDDQGDTPFFRLSLQFSGGDEQRKRAVAVGGQVGVIAHEPLPRGIVLRHAGQVHHQSGEQRLNTLAGVHEGINAVVLGVVVAGDFREVLPSANLECGSDPSQHHLPLKGGNPVNVRLAEKMPGQHQPLQPGGKLRPVQLHFRFPSAEGNALALKVNVAIVSVGNAVTLTAETVAVFQKLLLFLPGMTLDEEGVERQIALGASVPDGFIHLILSDEGLLIDALNAGNRIGQGLVLQLDHLFQQKQRLMAVPAQQSMIFGVGKTELIQSNQRLLQERRVCQLFCNRRRFIRETAYTKQFLVHKEGLFLLPVIVLMEIPYSFRTLQSLM